MSNVTTTNGRTQVSGVFPHLAQVAELGPPRSEIGIGCLMPWAGKLYVLNYNSHKMKSGRGTSLRVIDEELNMTVVAETKGIDGTYTNRFVHAPSNRIVIGPHVIDEHHNIHTIEELVQIRCCGTTWHLKDKENLVYVLGMEGELFELNVRTLECRQICDLTDKLDTEAEGRTHYKDCYSQFGRLVVCSNEYAEEDWKGERAQGRLAEWDGNEDSDWTILERKPFTCVYGRGGFAGTMFATGWDQASAIMKVFTNADGQWRTYRLPKASHTHDHKWQTEWPRIRETEHERFLMDLHGMWYELSPWAYGNRVWGVKPISQHLWVHADFCSWRGMLVVGGDNASPTHGSSPTTAEPQSGMWFGKTDDLWQFGKPAGWGGPWWQTPVTAGEPSDPYLMTGFENKSLHVSSDDNAAKVTVQVDFMGHGKWCDYLTLDVAAGGYANHCFPVGFSAHWVRCVADADATLTAQLHYT